MGIQPIRSPAGHVAGPIPPGSGTGRIVAESLRGQLGPVQVALGDAIAAPLALAQSMGRLADLVQKLSDSVADFKLPEERGTGE